MLYTKQYLYMYILVCIVEMSQSYTKGCRDCGQQIRMAEVNGKWAAYELDGNGFHTCKQQQQQKKQEQPADVNSRADGHQTKAGGEDAIQSGEISEAWTLMGLRRVLKKKRSRPIVKDKVEEIQANLEEYEGIFHKWKPRKTKSLVN